MRFASWMVCAGVLAAPLASRAEDPELPPAVASLLGGPEHRAALLQAARAVDGPGAPGCATATYTTTGTVGILQPLQMDAAGKLIGGAWKEQVRESGCGSERLLNALTVASPGGALETRPMLPGSTIADPRLQGDSVRYAAGAMGGMPAGCEQGAVLDTRYVGLEGQPPGTRPAPNGPVAAWSEIWTLQACAKRVQVEMHFKPDATGTDIRANPAQP